MQYVPSAILSDPTREAIPEIADVSPFVMQGEESTDVSRAADFQRRLADAVHLRLVAIGQAVISKRAALK